MTDFGRVELSCLIFVRIKWVLLEAQRVQHSYSK